MTHLGPHSKQAWSELSRACCYTTNSQGNIRIPANIDICSLSLFFILTVCYTNTYTQLHCLRLLNEIILTYNPSLLRIASSLVDPVFALLSHSDHFLSPSHAALRKLVYSNVSSILAVMPTVFLPMMDSQALSARASVTPTACCLSVIVDHFQQAMYDLTASQMTVTSSSTPLKGQTQGQGQGDATPAKEDGHAHIPQALHDEAYLANLTQLFQVIDHILLYTGSFLSAQLRDRIEYLISKGLACLMKGVLLYQPTHRHLRRAPCEVLRVSPAIELLLIKLAVTDILIPTSEGGFSGNVSSLRLVCQSLQRQRETSAESVRALAVIDAILNPSRITLPSNHFILQQRKPLTQLYTHGTTSAYSHLVEEDDAPADDIHKQHTDKTVLITAEPPAVDHIEASKVTPPIAPATNNPKKRKVDKPSTTSSSTSTAVGQAGAAAASRKRPLAKSTATAAVTVEQEEDGDLPDIVF